MENKERSGQIVIIDDDLELPELYKDLLEVSLNFEESQFSVFRSVEDAQKFLSSDIKTPKLIILNYQLPGKYGMVYLKELKDELSSLRDIPVIVITGDSHPNIKESSENIGAAIFLFKPLNNIDFVEAVKLALIDRNA